MIHSCKNSVRLFSAVALAALCCALAAPPAGASEVEPIAPHDAAQGEEVGDSLLDESAEERSDRYWYLIVGPANVYPRLEESENEINRDINGLFGNILPRWNEPDTFKDLRDSGKLWDVHVGLGYSLNDHWSLFSTAGFIMGTVRTRNDYYPLLIQTEIFSKFHRKVGFISFGVDYHPWGKAKYEEMDPDRNWFTRRLFAGKPYLEAAIGYVNVYTVGQVKVSVPLLGDIAKVKHAEYYDLMYASPRIGIDFPLTENTNLGLMAGYLFFTSHPDEFDSQSYYLFFKHKL